jgi:hypothetical protein
MQPIIEIGLRVFMRRNLTAKPRKSKSFGAAMLKDYCCGMAVAKQLSKAAPARDSSSG